MCAGPYSQTLLGISRDLSEQIETQLVKKEDNELLRPGCERAHAEDSRGHAVPLRLPLRPVAPRSSLTPFAPARA